MAHPSPTLRAPAFSGEFRHRLEGKRVTIPAKWRFEEEVELFMVPKTLKRCISVMPREEVERIQMQATADMIPEDRANFLDAFGRRLRQATLDKAGRVTIPDDLREQFGLTGEVWLSGSLNSFNIWNVSDFEADQQLESKSAEGLMRRLGI